jgi:hypothetical protein
MAFSFKYLILKDGTTMLPQYVGNKLQTSMAQHPRTAKISNTETAWIKKCWATVFHLAKESKIKLILETFL